MKRLYIFKNASIMKRRNMKCIVGAPGVHFTSKNKMCRLTENGCYTNCRRGFIMHFPVEMRAVRGKVRRFRGLFSYSPKPRKNVCIEKLTAEKCM